VYKGEGNQKKLREDSFSPLFSNGSFEFSLWLCVAKLSSLVEGNGSLGINKTVRSKLF
jgi:hypothetical protein